MKRFIALALLAASATAAANPTAIDMDNAKTRYTLAKRALQALPADNRFLTPVIMEIIGETSATTDRMIVATVAKGKTCEDLKLVVIGRMDSSIGELPFKADDYEEKELFVEKTMDYIYARCELLTIGIIN